jgi:hypothetical protein
MLTEGLERLTRRGARRLKVAYASEMARDLYLGAGFRAASSSSTHSRKGQWPQAVNTGG